MKTLVTGATGFIGSAVVRKLLGRGREVKCYVEPRAKRANLEGLDVEVVEGDVNDRECVAAAMAGCDVLYHLAAIYALFHPHPERIYEVNVEGTKTVLWAAYKAGLRKVVYTSSIAAVGDREDGAPADEITAFNLWKSANAYVRSKYLSERDALRFAREGLPVVAVNPAFPFGERDIGPTPTGDFVVQTLRGRMKVVTPGGFCAIDVEDVAEGHVLAEEKGRVGERYILGNHNLSYREFFDLVAEVGGVAAPRAQIPSWLASGAGYLVDTYFERVKKKAAPQSYKVAKYAARNMYYDTSKARTELGLPITPLRETVERAVHWFRAHGYA